MTMKPIKFGEGMQPGTVEWERLQTQRREERRRFREMQHQRESDIRRGSEDIPTTYSFFLVRWFARLSSALRHQ